MDEGLKRLFRFPSRMKHVSNDTYMRLLCHPGIVDDHQFASDELNGRPMLVSPCVMGVPWIYACGGVIITCPPSSLGPRVQLPAYNFHLRRSRDEDYRTRFSTQHAQDGCEYGFINVLSSEPDGVDQVNTVCVAFFSLRDVLSEPALLRSPMTSARRRSRLRA